MRAARTPIALMGAVAFSTSAQAFLVATPAAPAWYSLGGATPTRKAGPVARDQHKKKELCRPTTAAASAMLHRFCIFVLAFLPLAAALRRPSPHHRIPRELVLTGPATSLASMGALVQQNVYNTLRQSPNLRVRWFDDMACEHYIRKNYDEELLRLFQAEEQGAFRGDICRTAVLAHDGGFYADVDVEVRGSLVDLVDSDTSFMSVRAASSGTGFTTVAKVLNALLASEPGGKVMQAALSEIRNWYARGRGNSSGVLMGPTIMAHALQKVVAEECPERQADLHRSWQEPMLVRDLQWPCGKHEQIRLYSEARLICAPRRDPQVVAECPDSRLNSSFEGVRYGIFEPHHDRNLVAYPRFEGCGQWGCGSGGHRSKKLAP